jgi:hypothetical protein
MRRSLKQQRDRKRREFESRHSSSRVRGLSGQQRKPADRTDWRGSTCRLEVYEGLANFVGECRKHRETNHGRSKGKQCAGR